MPGIQSELPHRKNRRKTTPVERKINHAKQPGMETWQIRTQKSYDHVHTSKKLTRDRENTKKIQTEHLERKTMQG